MLGVVFPSVSTWANKTYVGHGGSCPGYRTQLSLQVKDKLAVIVMTNAHDVSPGGYATEIFNIIAVFFWLFLLG